MLQAGAMRNKLSAHTRNRKHFKKVAATKFTLITNTESVMSNINTNYL